LDDAHAEATAAMTITTARSHCILKGIGTIANVPQSR
jgi:hypothetical protein